MSFLTATALAIRAIDATPSTALTASLMMDRIEAQAVQLSQDPRYSSLGQTAREELRVLVEHLRTLVHAPGPPPRFYDPS